MQNMYSYARKLFSLVFPHLCAGCGSEAADFAVCESCRKFLKFSFSGPEQFGNFKLHHLYDYHQPLVRSLIHLLKYDGVLEIANFFGDQACLYLEQNSLTVDTDWIISWVPLHPHKQRMRGFNQSELVARLIADYFGARALELLEKRKATVSQARLNQEQRTHNLRGCFSISCPEDELAARPILLIDDVCTTASTLKECVKVLRENGAKNISCLVIARD